MNSLGIYSATYLPPKSKYAKLRPPVHIVPVPLLWIWGGSPMNRLGRSGFLAVDIDETSDLARPILGLSSASSFRPNEPKLKPRSISRRVVTHPTHHRHLTYIMTQTKEHGRFWG